MGLERKLEARATEREYLALVAIARRDHAGNPSAALRAVVREAAKARGLWDRPAKDANGEWGNGSCTEK